MIQISNLTKIYKSKKKNNCKALDNINLTISNTGLVFIIGKSGSGKSTLLNLLGGLDNTTSGNIIVDGNDITKFNERDLANYRNNHIGFIFQDYHLLDELTVYENIVLSLNLNKIEDNGLVIKALEKVGLKGYENRYPQELSGGERQRVAIARAIVKKPYIILADEPTGNLDNVTATSIVELLKELSKECLILIVSHNTIDTYKYADRIIKLSYGKIISDESKNPEYLDNVTYKEGIIYYPMDKTLSEEDINFINEKEFNKIIGKSDKYITTSNNNNKQRDIKIDKKNLSIKNIFKLCLTFLKSKVFRIAASSFMIAVIMVILALSETIITFDSGEIISNEMNKMNHTSLLITKESSFQDEESSYKYYETLTEETIDKFYEAGYTGDIYPVLSYSVPIHTYVPATGRISSYFSNSIFIDLSLGTLIVDEQFLLNKLGKVEYICVSDTLDPCGLYITDYIADSILARNLQFKGKNKSYEDILGEYTYSNFANASVTYINGIIKTNYKEKYKDLLSVVVSGNYEKVSEIYNLPQASDFFNEIYSYLGFSYSFNSNLVEDLKTCETIDFGYLNRVFFDDVEMVKSRILYSFAEEEQYNISDNEVVMDYEKYNEVFGTNYTSETLSSFVPHKTTITSYAYSDIEKKNKLIEEEIYIKELIKTSCLFYTSDDLIKKISSSFIQVYGLYFDGLTDIDKVIDIYTQEGFENKSYIFEGVYTMTRAVDVFIPIFELVAIVLCAGIVFILINFSTKMIKDKLHDIGILKALGCKNNTIGIVFGLQVFLIAIFTIILSTIGYFFFIDLANDVLIESLKVLAKSHVVLDLDFLTFKMNIVFINSILVMILTIISLVIPMVKIYRIKPVKIIKTNE